MTIPTYKELRAFIEAAIVIASYDRDEESEATIAVSNQSFRMAEAYGTNIREFETMRESQLAMLMMLLKKVVRS